MSAAAEIPIIDFADARAGDPAAMRAIAAEIHRACTTVGFFYIANHGIPDAVIAGAAAAARQFFAFPVETKREVSANANHRGFHARGDALMYGAQASPTTRSSTASASSCRRTIRTSARESRCAGPTTGRRFMPALQPALYGYFKEVGACGADLLRAVALSLGLDETFFAARYTKPLQRTQIIYYPPQPPTSEEEQFGVAPHSDYGCITLLWQDDNGGLQVRSLDKKRWVDARPISGTLVVNVGDLLARWTNGRFASTVHRVINASGRERFSIATFFDPDFATVVDPRDLGGGEPDRRYEPVRAGDYILARFDEAFGYRKKDAKTATATA